MKYTHTIAALAASIVFVAPAALAQIESLDKRVAEGRTLLDSGQFAEAEAKFKSACKAKVGQGCYFQATTIRRYRYTPDALNEIKALKAKSCDLKYGQGCFSAALDYRMGAQGTDMDKAKGRDLMDKSCNYGWGAGCGALATDHQYGFNEAEKDEAKALDYFEKACDAKLPSAEACKDLALIYGAGKPTNQDLDRAIDAIKKANKLSPEDREIMSIGRILVQKQDEQNAQ